MFKILNDTAAFYNSNNRAISREGTCVYKTQDNKCCAIGRYFTDTHFNAFISSEMTIGVDLLMERFELRGVKMPEELIGIPKKFLRSLQMLHDSSEEWDERGLTVKGHLEKQRLIDQIKTDYFIYN